MNNKLVNNNPTRVNSAGVDCSHLHELSDDPQVNLLLNEVVNRLKQYTEKQTNRLNELTKIGVALSSTCDINKLLEMIVDKARQFTNADGGTLYLVNEEQDVLDFSIFQNESQGTRQGGATGVKITLTPVPLKVDGKPNHKNVSAFVANVGEPVNIPDVYEVDGFDFSGMRAYDEHNNYRSKSMLVIPMRNYKGDIIGVLQLINAQDPNTGEVIPFASEYQMLTEALASQAAVSLDNATLINELQELFESFIRTIAAAIDEKSPYTSGHIERVSNLTMAIANRINAAETGHYADVKFTEDELTELRLAAWLHDTGKITTPEYVVDKRTKLETIFDRMELVRMRFEVALANERMRALEAKIKTGKGSGKSKTNEIDQVETEKRVEQLIGDLSFISDSNATSEFVSDPKLERIKEIAARKINTSLGIESLLTENELYNLCIRKLNLTTEERSVINNHATMTFKLLEELPFPKNQKNVPFIASSHHEKLNGKGYPLGLIADEIPLQVRILTLADVFEALTSSDRPYKQPKKLSEAVRILGFTVKDGEMDADLVNFFLSEKMHLEYARNHMKSDMIDIVD